MDEDAGIRSTNDLAAHARVSAVRQGYLQDDFISLLVPRSKNLPTHAPLINIGTYVRSEAIDRLIREFLQAGPGQKQIISIGAGSDTRFWRLMSGPLKDTIASYVELDFPEITSKKAMTIRKSKVLSSTLGDEIKVVQGGTGLSSSIYHLFPVDLRLPPKETIQVSLMSSSNGSSAILQPTIPTLVLAECVLVYMTPEQSSAILQWFSDTFETLCTVIYEMFSLDDSFGRVMKQNLLMRAVALPGVEAFPTLSSIKERFINAGFKTSDAVSLNTVRQQYFKPSELERIANLELVDEYEELELVLNHYALAWGSKVASHIDDEHPLRHWTIHCPESD